MANDIGVEQPVESQRKRITNYTDRDVWKLYDSKISSYEETFEGVLHGKHIVDLLSGIKNPVIIDLMAPAGTIYDLFISNNIHGRGIALSMQDYRDPEQVAAHEQRGIKQIRGDITHSEVWKRVQELLAGGKADLVMERAAGGIENLPFDRRLYKALVDKAWELLKEDGGIVLFEGPSQKWIQETNLDLNLNGWFESLKKSGIDVVFVPSVERPEESKGNSAFMITRHPDSPVKLPLPSIYTL